MSVILKIENSIAHINLAKGFRGGERQTAILIEELSKVGYIQKLFVRKDGGEISLKSYLQSKKIENLEIIEISKPYFLHIYKFQSIKLVHAHETKAVQLAYFINIFLKIPYIVTRRVQFTPKKNFFNRLIYKNAKSLVALSKAIKDDWIKLEKSLKIDIVPSAYIKESFSDEKISISNRKDLKIVGFIGAIVDEHKGVCTILESAKLLQNREDIHFVLIGNGIDYNLCVNRSRYLKNITFLGFQNNPQKFINDFDVFVFPSNHEGLGSTLLDVMRFGKPIIASSVGGIVDLIKDSENGYLIEPQKPEILKNKILGILSKPELADKFKKRNLELIDNFSPEKMRERYETLYKKD